MQFGELGSAGMLSCRLWSVCMCTSWYVLLSQANVLDDSCGEDRGLSELMVGTVVCGGR